MHLDKETLALMRSVFGEDENGDIFLRLSPFQVEGEVKRAVRPTKNPSLKTLLKRSITKDENGVNSIRFVKS